MERLLGRSVCEPTSTDVFQRPQWLPCNVTAEEMEKPASLSYQQLVAVIDNGALMRKKLLQNVDGLAEDVHDLLDVRRKARDKPATFAPREMASASPGGASASRRRLPSDREARADVVTSRPCACGCGALRRVDSIDGSCGCCEQSADWQLAAARSRNLDVDAAAQRASILRMAQPRKTTLAKPTDIAPTRLGKPDVERLGRLAMPHKARIVELGDEPPTRLGKPDLERLDFMSMPREAARRRRDQLEEEAQAQAPAVPSVRYSLLGDLDDGDPRIVPVRSTREQQSYLQERLYTKPLGRPGSIAALQMKLDALRQGRIVREEVGREADLLRRNDGRFPAASGGRSRSTPALPALVP